MNKKSKEFLEKMLEFLPSTVAAYRQSITFNGEVLETVIVEDIFMPEIIRLLKEEKNTNLLESIFKYFDEVSNDEDIQLTNLFQLRFWRHLEMIGKF